MTRFAQRFVLEREIGAGGMARVYLGRDEVLDRPVAIKILNPHHSGTEIGARFRREGRTAARLSHPNIVQVYDAGEDELEGREVSNIVMEYVPGGDLKGFIDEEGSLPSDELAGLGSEVASGLAHAHEKGVIHRDIKPHNILMDAHGRPKLTDFGIARALGATQATRTGSYLGTALYSSPEQLRGEKVTPKSDVYSLGMSLYQAAVGEAPFGGTPIEVASQHVSREPDAPSALGVDLSDGVETLILDCVQKDPERRPTAEEVRERLLDETRPVRTTRAPTAPPVSEPSPTGHTRPEPEVPPTGPPPGATGGGGGQRRWPTLLAAAALLLVLLGIATAAAFGVNPLTTLTVQGENEQASSPEDPSSQPAGSDQESTFEQAASEDNTNSSSGSGSDSESAAAEQALEEHYRAAVDGDYDEAWNSLSAGFQQRIGSQGAYTNQFGTLESLDFEEGPRAQVSGNTATVSGVTIATHTDRTERNIATWTLVSEGGEWKVDNITINNRQLI
ncbi:MAG TPA: serine/threonine-protein kinase [Rubrobacteraceae bacterium]|nr:serine/threonine-protein kinase [Rubrobacteraceae bacterium]